MLWLAKIQEKREFQKGVTVQVRNDKQGTENERFGVETVVFMKERAGRSTAHAKRLWGYCHTQTVWFGVECSQYLARCWSFKALLDGAQSLFLIFERHDSRRKAWNDPGILFETSAAWRDMIPLPNALSYRRLPWEYRLNLLDI